MSICPSSGSLSPEWHRDLSLRRRIKAMFRMSGREPQLWDPTTGSFLAPLDWRQTDNGRTEVTLPLKTDESVFVELEIRVVKNWVNRLIGDAGLRRDQRLTWTTNDPYLPTDALVTSGLIGPVHLPASSEHPAR